MILFLFSVFSLFFSLLSLSVFLSFRSFFPVFLSFPNRPQYFYSTCVTSFHLCVCVCVCVCIARHISASKMPELTRNAFDSINFLVIN